MGAKNLHRFRFNNILSFSRNEPREKNNFGNIEKLIFHRLEIRENFWHVTCYYKINDCFTRFQFRLFCLSILFFSPLLSVDATWSNSTKKNKQRISTPNWNNTWRHFQGNLTWEIKNFPAKDINRFLISHDNEEKSIEDDFGKRRFIGADSRQAVFRERAIDVIALGSKVEEDLSRTKRSCTLWIFSLCYWGLHQSVTPRVWKNCRPKQKHGIYRDCYVKKLMLLTLFKSVWELAGRKWSNWGKGV